MGMVSYQENAACGKVFGAGNALVATQKYFVESS